LELQKGYQLAGNPAAVRKFSRKKDVEYLTALEGFAKTGSGRLGGEFVEPIVSCLRGFEGVDSGFDDPASQTKTLGEFKRRVVDNLVVGQSTIDEMEPRFAVGEPSRSA
jgi:hypothetical protein